MRIAKVISAAVEDEREMCAMVVQSFRDRPEMPTIYNIATAIRERSRS
jgi:hypothetical protein